jgi:hypothetical protein
MVGLGPWECEDVEGRIQLDLSVPEDNAAVKGQQGQKRAVTKKKERGLEHARKRDRARMASPAYLVQAQPWNIERTPTGTTARPGVMGCNGRRWVDAQPTHQSQQCI